MAGATNYVSVSRRPPDVEDYIDMLRRYRSWIIGPTFAGLVVAVVVAFLWPDTYRSIAVMRITPQKVSERLVPSELTQRMSERLSAMETEILSRSTLAAMINQPSLNLYPKEKLQKPVEDIVQEMRNKSIQIRMLSMSGNEIGNSKGSSAFSISFDYPDRYKAKQVVEQLVTKFMDQNTIVLKQNTKLTTQFLDDELKTASDRLNELSQKITKFKMQNQGKLPEQAESNVAMVSSLQQAVATDNEALSRASNEKMMQESRLNELQNSFAFYSQRTEDTIMTGGTPGQISVKNQRLIDLQQKMSEFQTTLSEARKMYRDDYPPIKSLIAKIENLQRQIDAVEKSDVAANANANTAGTAPTAVKVTNPQVQQRLEELKSQINTVNTSIAMINNDIQTRQAHIVEMNKRIAEFQARIESAPLNEQQYNQLMNDYNLAKQQYDLVTHRKEQSETQENMNEQQVGESLELLDSASLPESSFEPNRGMWVGIGTALGLMIGVMLAGAREMKDTSLKNLKDVRTYTNLPVLSSIPLLENALLVRRKRRLFWLAWSSAFILGSIAMSGAMYYHFFGGKS
jgi:succinoglycan biosynthesis transport protein ExoP